MGMGDYGEHCGNCDHFDGKRSDRRFCELHDFVMPIASENVICADWQRLGGVPKNLAQHLADGVLYLWNPYLYSPKALDRFEAVQELVIDVQVRLVENPDYGFAFYLSACQDLFPNPGEVVSIYVDQVPIQFQIHDIEITVTYTSRNSGGELVMEDRREVQRVALPVNEVIKQALLQWINEHHDLAAARNMHHRNLENPRFLNKNRALCLLEKITGKPEARLYYLQRGLDVPLIP